MHVRFYEDNYLLHISISICLSLLHAQLPGTYHTLVPCSGPTVLGTPQRLLSWNHYPTSLSLSTLLGLHFSGWGATAIIL